jgi:TonB family protein
MPENFELGLLPERKMDWRTLATSYSIEVLLILLVLFIGLLWPQHIAIRPKYSLTELVPPQMPDHKPATARPPRPQIVAQLLPPVLSEPKLIVPKEFEPPKKKIEVRIEAPKLEAKFVAPVLPAQGGALPARLVYTGSFGNSAPAAISAPLQTVQTGGFGDPNGVRGAGKENAHLTATQMGSFDLAAGGGKGNGGSSKGVPGTIASAGFGSGMAQAGQTRSQGTAQVGGFDTHLVGANSPKRLVDNGPVATPVNITYKPSPNYTEEARNLQLQGEVLLEVVFAANGQLHVNRVVRGLGHGLDEAAIAAANKIQFKPALREGSPIDSTAVVHVVFELAM